MVIHTERTFARRIHTPIQTERTQPMIWTEHHTEGVEELLKEMDEAPRRAIQAEAAHLFAQMKLLGFAEALPDTLPQVNRDQAARLLQLALNVRATAQALNLAQLPFE